MPPPDALFPIGELARLTGVPVKTIRHYSDLGLLPPRQVTRARYRLYGPEDQMRLESIRLLRSLDFDLDTIAALLARRRPMRTSLAVQLGAVDARLRRLRRTRAVLARAVDAFAASDGAGEALVLETVRRLSSIAMLDATERGAVLRRTMEGHLRGIPVDPEWQAQLWDAAFAHLPEEPSDAQWDALFELAMLVRDEDFGRRLAAQARAFWTRRAPGQAGAWQSMNDDFTAGAAAAHDRGERFDSDAAHALVDRFVAAAARSLGKRPDRRFRRWLVRQGELHDPRAERFWQLVALLRGGPREPPPRARAMKWLFAALVTQG